MIWIRFFNVLRINSHGKLTSLRWTIQWHLLHSQCCLPTLISSLKIFNTAKQNHLPIIKIIPTYPLLLCPGNFQSSFCLWIFHVNEITQYVIIYVWLLSLIIVVINATEYHLSVFHLFLWLNNINITICYPFVY